MLVVTTENIPGKKYEVLGEVFGVTTQSKNFVRYRSWFEKYRWWRN